jgi:hypothetical protein
MKELSSDGLLTARFRHPAGLNGCRAAGPLLLRLYHRHPLLAAPSDSFPAATLQVNLGVSSSIWSGGRRRT